MKIKYLILLITCTYVTISSNAQLKIVTNGTVKVRGDIATDDPLDEVSMIIYGKNGTNLANGRLAIGDYGKMSTLGANVFIGEYGTNIDSDIFQLHGKNGIYFTRSAGETVAYYKYSEGNKFNFSCDVYAYGVKLTSDIRSKSNISDLEKMLPMLTQLNGISYNLNLPENSFQNSIEGELTEKEKNYQSEYLKLKEQHIKKEANKKRLGFIAQDVQKIFPDLVEQDSAGFLSIDYIGLIPVLVESIKELEERVEALENNCCNENLKFGIIDQNHEIKEAKLYQNAPNPFNNQTLIQFEVPISVNKAQLHLCNMTGTLLRTINIDQRELGSVSISANEFIAGMYLYSLVCDGKIVDTKQMMLLGR